MRTAETVLNILRERGQRGLPVEKLYRLLFRRDLYLRAYSLHHGASDVTTRESCSRNATVQFDQPTEGFIRRWSQNEFPLDVWILGVGS